MGAGCGLLAGYLSAFQRVHLWHMCRIQDLQDLPELALVLWWCVPSLLSALSLCLWHIMLEYGYVSRFKGVFSVVWGCCVGLLGFGALRGLCGFCARVELGGLKACCVFASVFLLLSLCLLSFYALCLSSGALSLLSSACPLACLVCFCGLVGFCYFFFPYGLYAKRKGAPCWCVLSCPDVVFVSSVLMYIKILRLVFLSLICFF